MVHIMEFEFKSPHMSDEISTVFYSGIPYKVVILEGEEVVEKRELLEWYIDGSKKDTGTEMKLFEMGRRESNSMNLSPHATAFQAEVVVIYTYTQIMVQRKYQLKESTS